MRANRILQENVLALLKARGANQRQLAHSIVNPKTHRRFTEVWISSILQGKRGLPVEHLDAIADFFGLKPYQLFQPGIAAVTERRKGKDRRIGRDRRIGPAGRELLSLDGEIASAHPRRGDRQITVEEWNMLESFRRKPPMVQEGILGILRGESSEEANPTKLARRARQKGVANL